MSKNEEFPQYDPKDSEVNNTERSLEREGLRLRDNAETLSASLAEIEASSPTRAEKISGFIDKNWFTIMGGSVGVGGAWGLGENMASGSWEKIAIGLGLGVGMGKILEMVAKKSMKSPR